MKEEIVDVSDVLGRLQRAALLNCSISPHRDLFNTAGGVIRALVLANYHLTHPDEQPPEPEPVPAKSLWSLFDHGAWVGLYVDRASAEADARGQIALATGLKDDEVPAWDGDRLSYARNGEPTAEWFFSVEPAPVKGASVKVPR